METIIPRPWGLRGSTAASGQVHAPHPVIHNTPAHTGAGQPRSQSLEPQGGPSPRGGGLQDAHPTSLRAAPAPRVGRRRTAGLSLTQAPLTTWAPASAHPGTPRLGRPTLCRHQGLGTRYPPCGGRRGPADTPGKPTRRRSGGGPQPPVTPRHPPAQGAIGFTRANATATPDTTEATQARLAAQRGYSQCKHHRACQGHLALASCSEVTL